MAKQVITVGTLFQGGRVSSQDPTLAPTYIRFAQDIGADPYEFQFPAGASSALTFGIPRSVFIDASNNQYEMSVEVSITGQTFSVPANSTGFYLIDASAGSSVTITSAGDPTGIVEFIFYNYERTPFVWYKFGNNVVAASIPNGGDVALGSTTDAPQTNPTASATLISVAKGILTGINNLFSSAAGIVVRQATAANLNAKVVSDDGGIATIGAKADPVVLNPGIDGSVVSLLKGIMATLNDPIADDIEIVGNNTGPYSYRHITTATTTVVKNAAGVLSGITINTGAAGTATIYDNTSGSGNIVAVVDTTNQGFINFGGGNGISAATGITVVTSAAADVTITYR